LIGWLKVADAAKYAGVSIRTFREWLKDGLERVKLPSGTILIKPASIDAYLEQFKVCEATDISRVVDDLVSDVMPR
jgi:excisionase family DNA binding protein